MCCDAPTEDELQEFIDGRLDGPARARVAAFLLRHPEHSGEVRNLQKLTRALQELDRDILDEPIPQRLLDILKQARENE